MARTPIIDIRRDYGRNHIINGNFDIWQRDVSLNINNSTLYLADRFFGSNSSDGAFIMTQSTDVPNGESEFSLQKEVTTADTSLTGTQVDLFGYRMEGNDLQSLKDRTFTLAFYVKASVAGAYSVAFRNDASDRSYVTEYTINQANTWEKKEITLTHDSTGTWNYDQTLGMRISWMTSCGPTYQTSNLDQWQNGLFVASTNQANLMASVGNTFKITQVQINEGAEALPFRRAGRTWNDELQLCKRYFQKSYALDTAVSTATTAGVTANGAFHTNGNASDVQTIRFPTAMRIAPTVTPYSTSGTLGSGLWVTAASSAVAPLNIAHVTEFSFNIQATGMTGGARGQSVLLYHHWTADAEL